MILIAIIIVSFTFGCMYTELRILKDKKPIKLKLPKILKTKERIQKDHETAEEEGANPAYQ